MGFFSSIKRLFSGSPDETPASVAVDTSTGVSVDDTVNEPVAEPAEALTPTSDGDPAQDSLPADLTDAAPQPEPTPLSDTAPLPKPEPRPTPVQSLPESQPLYNDIDTAVLTRQLRETEPRLSAWMAIALQDIDRAGDPLWNRIRFLLKALGAADDEIESFVEDLCDWVTRMEYERLADFRSELQYRLALALELEDEEDERNRLFIKLSDGLARTRAQLGKSLGILFAAHGELTPAFWEELEEVFIMADMGVEAAGLLCNRLKAKAREAGVTKPDALSPLLAGELENIFRIPRRVVAVNPPEVVLMIGVNGVGKTTTIAKLAHRARSQGKKVMLAAGDTFRAAAVEQLSIWAQRTGSLFHAKGQDADPAAVAWEAVDKAVAEQVDVLFVDTAGRLHTKTNLMEELKKVRATLAKKLPGAPHRTVLILDATTGQNALSQVRLFNDAVGIDEIVLTKLDGTAKGGVAVAVALQFNIPITFVGLGEKMEDLRPFDGDGFARALLGRSENDAATAP